MFEPRESAEIHFARTHTKQGSALPFIRTKRSHDTRRHREESMSAKPKLIAGRAEDVFEALRGVAVRVQGARELQYEADGDGVWLIPDPS